MARLKALGSQLGTLPSQVKPLAAVESSYGQGRGGRPWRRLREHVMQRDKHLCQVCKAQGRYTEATQVDHIVPIAEGGTDDRVNLQAICTPCHDAKTLDESKRGIARTQR